MQSLRVDTKYRYPWIWVLLGAQTHASSSIGDAQHMAWVTQQMTFMRINSPCTHSLALYSTLQSVNFGIKIPKDMASQPFLPLVFLLKALLAPFDYYSMFSNLCHRNMSNNKGRGQQPSRGRGRGRPPTTFDEASIVSIFY